MTKPVRSQDSGRVQLSWFGWKVLDQERMVEAQRLQQRVEQSADRIAATLRGTLGETGELLGAASVTPPDDGLLLLLEDNSLTARPANRLLYYPVASPELEGPPAVFVKAEAAEFLQPQLVPGTRAMEKGDWATARAAFRKALEDYPDSVQAAWDLGSADLCLYKTRPSQAVPAIYAFARAAAIDPVKGMADPKWQQDTVRPFLEKVFQQYHGTDLEALEQLKRLAAKSPFPPEGFVIKSLTDIAREKQAAFENGHPQLSLWKIKAALSDGDGGHYFTSDLQGAGVPRLRGILVEAKPACHPN